MRKLLALVVVWVLIWTGVTAVTLVRPGERAVVKRFGRILPDQPAPGLYLGWPWGIDQVERVPINMVRSVLVGWSGRDEDDDGVPIGQLLTGDHNLVNIQAEMQYRVEEAQVDRFVINADRVNGLLARATENALADWAATHGVDAILLRGKALLPAWLKDEVQKRIAEYGLGVRIEQANVTLLNPPSEVRSFFDEVAQAQTRIRTQVNQAEQEADRRARELAAARFRIERQTAAYSQEETLRAQGEAETFLRRLQQYRKLTRDDPGYLNALWLDETTRLFAKMKEAGRLDLLDQHVAGDGLNITQFPPMPKKK